MKTYKITNEQIQEIINLFNQRLYIQARQILNGLEEIKIEEGEK